MDIKRAALCAQPVSLGGSAGRFYGRLEYEKNLLLFYGSYYNQILCAGFVKAVKKK